MSKPTFSYYGDFVKWLRDDIEPTLMDSHVCLSNMKRLENTEDQDELKVVWTIGFFKHVDNISGFVVISQMSKLLTSRDNDKRSFHKLFNRLDTRNFELDDDFNRVLEANMERPDGPFWCDQMQLRAGIDELRRELQSQQALIADLQHMRDTYTAHNDPRIVNGAGLGVAELEKIVTLGDRVHFALRRNLMGREVPMRHEIADESIDPVLTRMADWERNARKRQSP